MNELFDAEGNYTNLASSFELRLRDTQMLDLIAYAREQCYDMRHAEYIIISTIQETFLIERLKHRSSKIKRLHSSTVEQESLKF